MFFTVVQKIQNMGRKQWKNEREGNGGAEGVGEGAGRVWVCLEEGKVALCRGGRRGACGDAMVGAVLCLLAWRR